MEQEKNTRKKDFKKIITIDEARRKREDSIVQIRKQKREEKLRRRRVVSFPSFFSPNILSFHFFWGNFFSP